MSHHIIYCLKQKEHKRVKIGSTTNIQQRIEKLEKHWGKFDSNSEVHYLDINSLNGKSLSLDNIEKTIQRFLKLKNQYIEFGKEHSTKDGKTEFFILDEILLKDIFSMFREEIVKTTFVSELKALQTKRKILPISKYLIKKKENEDNLKSDEQKSFRFFDSGPLTTNDSGEYKVFIENNRKFINLIEKTISPTFIEYSLINDYKRKVFYLTIIAKDKKLRKQNFTNFTNNLSEVTRFSEKNKYSTFCGSYTTEYLDNAEILRLPFYYSNYGKAKIKYIKLVIYTLIAVLKIKELRKVKFISHDKEEILERYRDKQLWRDYYNNNNDFYLEYSRNGKMGKWEISFNDIVEVLYRSEQLDILLTNGKKINLTHEWYYNDISRQWHKYCFDSHKQAMNLFNNKKILSNKCFIFFSKISNIKYIKWICVDLKQ